MLLSAIRYPGPMLGLLGQIVSLPFILQAQSMRSFVSVHDRLTCLSQVQEKLKNDETLLEYDITDSLIYILVVSNDAISLVRQEIYPCFRKSLKEFRKKIASADLLGFTSLGRLMYAFLILPVEQSIAGKNRLIIIPGMELAGVPFEAFVSDRQYHSRYIREPIHYLIFDYEIIYQYSAVLWTASFRHPETQACTQPAPTEYSFIGFSPVFSGHPSLTPLPGARNEVLTIGSMFTNMGLSSCLLCEEDSRESRFKEVACRSRILHLATHSYRSKRDQAASGFLFWGYDPGSHSDSLQDGILTGNEILELHLHTDLIVLNSCSSGLIHAGAGLTGYPLPLNFLRAGARNILSSLWNVSDGVAGQFMVSFYRNWLNGLPYSAALRKVKLEMIGHPETSLPIVWAPYILIGQ